MMALVLTWPVAPTDTRLLPGAVHIWSAALTQSTAQTTVFWDSLSSTERERADRFHFSQHRQRFVVARGLLRLLIGSYLGIKPQDVCFELSAFDKPSLPTNQLFFNISHSEDVGLFAFCLETAVGVDVEQIKPLDDLNAIAARFFAPSEHKTLQALPPEQQTNAFFRCWTRKEAFIKLIGEGLSYPLDNFEVTLAADAPVRFLTIEGSVAQAANYQLIHLEPAANTIGALALPTGHHDLFCWQWVG